MFFCIGARRSIVADATTGAKSPSPEGRAHSPTTAQAAAAGAVIFLVPGDRVATGVAGGPGPIQDPAEASGAGTAS